MSRNHSRLGTAIQICLRVLSAAMTLAAALVMMTNEQSTVVFGIPVDAQYTYSQAFKFFAYANLVSCALCLLSLLLFLLIIARRRDCCSSSYIPARPGGDDIGDGGVCHHDGYRLRGEARECAHRLDAHLK
ncbi:CASP-like protein 1F1 [Rhodamnia argentea]|uniref:CASP-like protein n=1 Tax=Rhodamnia argentea TaxID=178133 RepID=A0ABM3GTG0_9MYRT|nr:CASP-like protein 1F1 [Rhodamnia argentea]